MRVNQGQELVVGGYTPTDKNFDPLVIGYYEGTKLNVCTTNTERVYTCSTGEAVRER